ncbi:MAG: hypothetical protein EOP49_05205, partial [Sphingobacteriales bacterium]
NHSLRKITIATGQVTLFSSGTYGFQDGSINGARFNSPSGMLVEANKLYIADRGNSRIRMVDLSNNNVTTFAGSGTFQITDNTGTNAAFMYPSGIASDGSGFLYVTDSNTPTIRRIQISNQNVVTIAGLHGSKGTTNGTGTAARFGIPSAVVHYQGSLYITDSENNNIRKMLLATGEVTVFAGNGTDNSLDGIGTAASLSQPSGISVDKYGNLYVSETGSNKIRRIIISTGEVSTIAGSGANSRNNGPGNVASFFAPQDMYVHPTNGLIYVADQYNNQIRTINQFGYLADPLPAGLTLNVATGAISGTPTQGSAAKNYTISAFNEAGKSSSTINITVAALAPTITSFAPVSTLPGKMIYISGTGLETTTAVSIGGVAAQSFFIASPTAISAVVAAGAVNGSVELTTTAGSTALAGFTLATAPSLSYSTPNTYTVDGNAITPLSVTNTGSAIPVRTYANVTTFAGTGTSGSLDHPNGLNASFSYPNGGTSDGTFIYVMDNNSKIRKINIATTEVTTLTGTSSGQNDGGPGVGQIYSPGPMVYDGSNQLYFIDHQRIRKVSTTTGVITTIAGSTSGHQDGVASGARFANPRGLVYVNGVLYVSDGSNHVIRKMDLLTNMVTTIAGTKNVNGKADGTGIAASFSNPQTIAYDNGNLYIADYGNALLRKLDLSTGNVTTIAGNGKQGTLDGIGTDAGFNIMGALTSDGSGNLYSYDRTSFRLRKTNLQTAEVTTIAGTGSQGTLNGVGQLASFSSFEAMIFDAGNLYILDNGNYRIRKVNLQGYTVSPALPTGLSLSATTGEISGTPSKGIAAKNYYVSGLNAIGGNSTAVNINIIPAVPTITALSSPQAAAGQFVTITGTNFEVVTQVTFGGTPALSFQVSSSTSITAKVGAGTSGSVEVTTAGGIASLPGFTFITAPAISYATPQTYLVDGNAITPLSPTSTGGAFSAQSYGEVSTLAGRGNNGMNVDAVGVNAYLQQVNSAYIEGDFLYFAESDSYIKKVSLSSGQVTTISGFGRSGSTYGFQNGAPGTATYNFPMAITGDGTGNLYVTDRNHQRIRKIVLETGEVSTYAGQGQQSFNNGAAETAYFNNPGGIAFDASGNMYVSDMSNQLIRKIDGITKVVSTFAGQHNNAGTIDGNAGTAKFINPNAMAYHNGFLYVGQQNAIRKIDMNGVVTTLAGDCTSSGNIDGIGNAAKFNNISSITFDHNGLMYVTDQSNQSIKTINITTGEVRTLMGGISSFVDGTQSAARFSNPSGIAYDGMGNLYVADQGNARIRKVSLLGFVSNKPLPQGLTLNNSNGQITGTPTKGQVTEDYIITGTNLAGSANAPLRITVTPGTPTITTLTPASAGAGRPISITGTNLDVVTAVSFGGTPAASFTVVSSTTINAVVGAGASGDVVVTTAGGTATMAGFVLLLPPALSYTPQTFALNTLITPFTPANTGGAVPTSIYGTSSLLAGTGSPANTEGTGNTAAFSSPVGITTDGAYVYIADVNNNRIRRISIVTGNTSLLAGGSSGSSNGTGTGASFSLPTGVVADGLGNLYVADRSNHRIRKIVTATGEVTTLAGSTPGPADGISTAAQFYFPYGIAYDGNGNLYVTEDVGHRIRKVVISTGEVSTLAGIYSTSGTSNGMGSAASFSSPKGIAYYNGNLYITDNSYTIR